MKLPPGWVTLHFQHNGKPVFVNSFRVSYVWAEQSGGTYIAGSGDGDGGAFWVQEPIEEVLAAFAEAR